jgi:flagellar biosynthesis protein FlhB
MSERNMPPSPGRLALARRAGLFVRSPLVGAGCVLVVLLAGGDAIGRLALGVSRLAQASWSRAGEATGRDSWSRVMRSLVGHMDEVAALVGTVMLWVVAAALVGAFVQTGPAWTLSTRDARRRLRIGPEAARRGRRAAAVVCVVGPLVVATWMLWSRRAGLADLAEREVADGATTVATSLVAAGWWLAGGLLLAGAVEHVAARLALRARLRMTREDVRREQAEQAGGAWRGEAAPVMDDRAAMGTAAAVLMGQDAAVVLRYEGREGEVPRVVAGGVGARAGLLGDLASEAGVPVVDVDQTVVRAILARGVGEVIAPEWYGVVGQAIASRRSVANSVD